MGLLCVATDLGFYAALAGSLQLSFASAKTASYLAGVVVGFLLNKKWTFQSDRTTWAEPVNYLLLYTVTLGVNVGCNSLVLAWYNEQKLLAFLVATGVTTVLNFLGMRLVTFRKGIEARREEGSASADTHLAA